jgi:DNA polymerase-1
VKTHIVIDGDILCYTASASVEKAIDWGDDFWTLHSDLAEAKSRVDIDIVEFVERLNGTSYTVCFSHRDNFRKSIYPEYKANRKDVRKPVCFAALREYIRECWPCATWPNLEADDVMGIMASDPTKNVVIVSGDKDMKTIPGKWFNPNNPDAGVLEVSREEADRNHLIQTLTGDRVDGYPGCPGIGPARAEKIVDGGWSAVVDAYVKAGLNESVALVQARMAYILRKGDYVRKSGRVKLWTPNRKGSNVEAKQAGTGGLLQGQQAA